MDPGADEIRFTLGGSPSVRGTGGNEHRVGQVRVPGRCFHDQGVVFASHSGDRDGLEYFHAVTLSLAGHALSQFVPRHPVREAGVVVETLGHASLAAEGRLLDDEYRKILARRVDGGGDSRRTAPDDDQVVHR